MGFLSKLKDPEERPAGLKNLWSYQYAIAQMSAEKVQGFFVTKERGAKYEKLTNKVNVPYVAACMVPRGHFWDLYCTLETTTKCALQEDLSPGFMQGRDDREETFDILLVHIE